MTAAHYQVGIPVHIEIEEPDAPSAVHLGSGADTAYTRLIGEGEISMVAVNGEAFAVKVRDKEILPTVVVVIGRIHTHSGTGRAIGTVSHSGFHSNFVEGAITFVDEQEVRDGIVGHKQIEQAVVIDIGSDGAKSFAWMFADARLQTNIGKC